MPSRRTYLALLLSGALILASCGSGDDESSETTEAPAPTSTAPTSTTQPGTIEAEVLDRVAGDVCQALDTWTTSISASYEDTPAELAGADGTEAARSVVVDWMASMSADTEALVEALGGVDLEGAEPLEAFVADLADRFVTLKDIIEDHEEQAAEISTDAPEAFGAEVEALVDEFNESLAQMVAAFEELDDAYPNVDLHAALASACDLEPLERGDAPEASDDPEADGT